MLFHGERVARGLGLALGARVRVGGGVGKRRETETPRAALLPWVPAFAGTTIGGSGTASAAGGLGVGALRQAQGERGGRATPVSGAIIFVVIEIAEGLGDPYDPNRNGIIEMIEALAAVSDYFAGVIEKHLVLALIALNLAV